MAVTLDNVVESVHKKAEFLREFGSLRNSVPPDLPGAAPTGNKPAECISPGFR
jgi:hypothetical protein